MTLYELAASDIVRFWAAIILGICIGLAGAYGKERHDGRNPDRRWLINRLLIYPFLALCAAAAAETLALTRTKTAFAAAILALLAFDALRAISTRFMKATGESIDQIVQPLKALPVIESHQASSDGPPSVLTERPSD